MPRFRLCVIVLATILLACHRRTVRQDSDQPPANDNRRVDDRPGDPVIAALFKDTTPSNAFVTEGRDYRVQNAADRQALQAVLKTERALWEARKPREYRFLSRTECFCPGPRGWLLVEVRANQPLRAWDRAGRRVNAGDWFAFTIDNLYDNLDRVNNQQSQVQIAFDGHFHYPRYVRTSMIYPDGWGITQIRALRPL
jgi:Family of unknown function (DUF6174)